MSNINPINSKADKVQGGTAGHLASLDAKGNLTDSTKAISDFATVPIAESDVTNLVTDLAAKASTSSLTSHTSATSAHGVAGAIVGTTDNQTLTNKTIDAAHNTLIGISTKEQVGVTYDGGGLAITTGATNVLVTVPISGTIVSNTLLADQSGSCVIAIRKCNYAGFPGSLTSIVASAPPTLSSAQKSTDSILTGWSTSVTAGDILQFSVTSATTVQRVSLSLQIVGA